MSIEAGRESARDRTSVDSGDVRRRRLAEIVDSKSLIRGAEIKLASGASSKFYFDMKPTAFDPEGATLISDLVLTLIADDRFDLVGGLEIGAISLVANVVQRSFPDRPLVGFFVRKKPKGHGTQRVIEGIGEAPDLTGKRALILEDVTTTGGSAMRAVAAVRAVGGVADTVVTVLDRQAGAEALMAEDGVRLLSLLTAGDFGL